MHNPFKIFLGFILLFNCLLSNGAEVKPPNEPLSSAYKEVLSDINKTIIDKKLSKDSKLNELQIYLKAAKPFVSPKEYSLLFQKAEATLFIEADNSDNTFNQLIFLLDQYNNTQIWVFSEPRDVITSKIIKLKDKAGKKITESNKISTTMLNSLLDIALVLELSYQGKFRDADVLIDRLYEEVKASGESYPQMKYMVSGLKLKSLFMRGDIVNAMRLSQELDEDFESVVTFFTKDTSQFSPKALSGFSSTLQIDIFLGKNDVVIKKASFLLSKIPSSQINRQTQEARSVVLRILADAHRNKGDMDEFNKYNNEAESFNKKNDYVDFEILFHDFYMALTNSNIELAKKTVSRFVQHYKNLYQFSDNKEKLLVSRVINEFTRHIKDEELALKNPNKCISVDCIKYRKELADYNLDLKNNVYRSPESGQLLKNIILLSEEIDQDEKKQKRSAIHAAKFAPILEDMYYKGLIDGVLDMASELQYLSALYDYYRISNNMPYASYFAKQYINKFQLIRSKINDVNNKDLVSFTDAQQDKLKSFSKTFFEVGDITSALMVLRIIKENEFFDFVRRKDIKENFLSSLSYSKDEDDLDLKITTVLSELRAMKSVQLNKNISLNENLLIKKSILKKEQDLDGLRKKLKLAVVKTSSKALSHPKQQAGIKLNPDEAVLQIFLMPDSVESYLTTNEKTEHFIHKIERERITAKILDFNLLLSKNSSIPEDKLESLSFYVLPDFTNILKAGKTKKLKIIADNYLTLIPLNILKVNSVALGELFVTEYVALGKNSNFSNQDSKPIFDAFGASKGNLEFQSLPGVKTEIETLMSIPMTATVKNRNSYLDKDFNRSQFIKSFTQGSSIVHIASHFRSQGNMAGLSQLLLGDGSVISLEDIRSDIPKLDTNLITLSACDTGDLIPSSKGQIFEGLSNTFQVNGAKNVISTLWSISDEATAKFMGIFYTLLLNNEISASEALFHTQNIFRHSSIKVLPQNISFKQPQKSELLLNLNQYSHPYYWAAFRLSALN